jgi:hypothetical protein
VHRDTDNRDARTDAEPHALLRVTDDSTRQVMTQAAVLQDLIARQLSVLRNTYPLWDVDLDRDLLDRAWWTAVLRRTVTLDMARAGILHTVRARDAIALAATLAWQSSLVEFHAQSRGMSR